jgi:hypothetical protein
MNYERYRQEIPSVGQDMFSGAVAIDWTFATLQTYFSLPGGQAIFTMKTDTGGETAMAAVVSSTKPKEISHLLIQVVTPRWPNFCPAVLYTDE